MASIQFFNEDIDFKLAHQKKIRDWITNTILSESKKTFSFVNVVFCSDKFLLSLNRKYLNHNFLTDILTFDHSENGDTIEGELYISIERIQDNCILHHDSFEKELSRVLIHGILHLLGYRDKGKIEKKVMRSKENQYLETLGY